MPTFRSKAATRLPTKGIPLVEPRKDNSARKYGQKYMNLKGRSAKIDQNSLSVFRQWQHIGS